MVTLAGKLVHSPVGLARLVPVRFRSTLVPRWPAIGAVMLRTGAAGLGTLSGEGCWATADAAASRTAARAGRERRRLMVLLGGEAAARLVGRAGRRAAGREAILVRRG